MKFRDMDTEDLVNDLWGAMIIAWLGASCAVMMPVTYFLGQLAVERPFEPMDFLFVVGFIGGIACCVPWCRIAWELQLRQRERQKYAARQKRG